MAEPARVLRLEAPNGYGRAPDEHNRIKGTGRAIAVAKFHELANRLASGELDSARVQWSDTHGLLVETTDGQRFDLTKEVAPEGALTRPISGLEYVTRTAWREDGSGTVQYTATVVEEL